MQIIVTETPGETLALLRMLGGAPAAKPALPASDAAWPTPRKPESTAAAAPARLTITVDGPPGLDKTRLGEWLTQHGPVKVRDAYCGEMRDGGRFDVRNDVFIDPPREV